MRQVPNMNGMFVLVHGVQSFSKSLSATGLFSPQKIEKFMMKSVQSSFKYAWIIRTKLEPWFFYMIDWRRTKRLQTSDLNSVWYGQCHIVLSDFFEIFPKSPFPDPHVWCLLNFNDVSIRNRYVKRHCSFPEFSRELNVLSCGISCRTAALLVKSRNGWRVSSDQKTRRWRLFEIFF